MALSDVKRLRLPISPADMVPEILNPLEPVLLGQQDIEWFHDGVDYFTRNFVGMLLTPPSNAALPNKRWRVRARSFNVPAKVTVLLTDGSTGKLLRRSIKADPTGGNNSLETFLAPGKFDPGALWQSNIQGGIRYTGFMATHGGYFMDGVPALGQEAYPNSGLSLYDCNFSPDQAAIFKMLALGSPGDPFQGKDFPGGFFVCFDWETGFPVLVNLDEFAQKVPPKAPVVTVPVSGSAAPIYKYTDAAFVGAMARSLAATTNEDARLGSTLLDLLHQTV